VERHLETAESLAEIRRHAALLEGEVLLEGWAAQRERGGGRVLGLVLVTSWRIVFVDVEGGLLAFPIAKIDYVERAAPAQVLLSAWYDQINLTFDSEAALNAALNLLRQDPSWNAAEIKLSRTEDDARGSRRLCLLVE
jgi:hypothetical protein